MIIASQLRAHACKPNSCPRVTHAVRCFGACKTSHGPDTSIFAAERRFRSARALILVSSRCRRCVSSGVVVIEWPGHEQAQAAQVRDRVVQPSAFMTLDRHEVHAADASSLWQRGTNGLACAQLACDTNRAAFGRSKRKVVSFRW